MLGSGTNDKRNGHAFHDEFRVERAAAVEGPHVRKSDANAPEDCGGNGRNELGVGEPTDDATQSSSKIPNVIFIRKETIPAGPLLEAAQKGNSLDKATAAEEEEPQTKKKVSIAAETFLSGSKGRHQTLHPDNRDFRAPKGDTQRPPHVEKGTLVAIQEPHAPLPLQDMEGLRIRQIKGVRSREQYHRQHRASRRLPRARGAVRHNAVVREEQRSARWVKLQEECNQRRSNNAAEDVSLAVQMSDSSHSSADTTDPQDMML